MTDIDLFYKMSKENPYTFKKWSFVTVKIISIKNKSILCKVLDNGLTGCINNFKADNNSNNDSNNDNNNEHNRF